jgi:hypothetical protein
MKIPANPERLQSGGILTKLLLGLGVLFVLGAIAWVLLLPALVVSQIHSKTGFTVKVDHLSVNPFTAKVAITGMVLKNPAGWPVEDFVELREFRVEASVGSLFSSRLIANEVVLDVARFTLVKNQQGVFNATAFSDAFTGGDASAQSKPKGPKQEFLIKHLVLKFDRLVYADHSGARPVTRQYSLNLNSELRDVDSVAKIINPIANASVGVLTDILNDKLNGRTDLLKDMAGAIQGAGKKSGEKLKGLLDSLDKKKP